MGGEQVLSLLRVVPQCNGLSDLKEIPIDWSMEHSMPCLMKFAIDLLTDTESNTSLRIFSRSASPASME